MAPAVRFIVEEYYFLFSETSRANGVRNLYGLVRLAKCYKYQK
jgi:hypothetical protein